MKKILIVMLTILLLLSLTSCKKEEVNNNEEETVLVNHIDSPLVIDYKHYDDTKFYEMIEEIKSLIEDGDTKALDLYDELLKEFKIIADYQSVSCVNYDVDYTNEYWQAEYEYSDILYNETRNAFLTVCHELTASKLADEFESHVNNNELYVCYLDYVSLSSAILELQNKESELMSEYTSLDYEADDYIDQAANIFMDLLHVRQQLAKELGYDNYIEYTDINCYHRDYDAKTLTTFYKAVKDMRYEDVYALIPTIKEDMPEYAVDGKQSLIDLKKTINGISEYIDEAYEYLDTNNLYWYDNSKYNSQTGYTLAFFTSYTPYIFNNLVEGPIDLYYQVHELGHFANYYYAPNEALIFNEGNYDLSEIHSQGFELLCINNVNDILDINNSNYRYKELDRCLNAIVTGCLYDEWQREIYSNPNITLEEIDELYNELAYEYGINENKEDISDGWKDVEHNFTFPGYFVSYATSMFAALQLYNTAKVDKDLAVSQYNEILLMDPIIYGYEYAIKNADMVMFTDYEKTLNLLNDMCDEIVDNVK